MATIKAIVNNSGKAEVADVPYPQLPADDYLIVRATAWAINPVDYQLLDAVGEESCHVGFDYAGVVVQVGPKVTKDFKIGDRIAGMVNGENILQKNEGSFAEYLYARGDGQIKIPQHLTDTDATTQGVAVATMAQALYRDLQLPWPDSPATKPFNIFIYGGSTAMGIAGLQFARLSGGTVIATASPSNTAYLESLGAHHVVDYRAPDIAEQVRKLGLGPIRYALDCRPSRESATACGTILSRDGGARYVALETGFDAIAESVNPSVEGRTTLAFSAIGQPWIYENKFREASLEDYEHHKKFVAVAEQLLEQGKVKAPRTFINRGGAGLGGILHGIAELRGNRVSGGKLVYTRE